MKNIIKMPMSADYLGETAWGTSETESACVKAGWAGQSEEPRG